METAVVLGLAHFLIDELHSLGEVAALRSVFDACTYKVRDQHNISSLSWMLGQKIWRLLGLGTTALAADNV